MNPNFDVRAEGSHYDHGQWVISITSNGYQWHTISVSIADREKAERIAAYLRAELAPEDARSYAATQAYLEKS